MFTEDTVSALKKIRNIRHIRSILLLLLLIGTLEIAIMLVVHPLNISEYMEAIIDAVLLVVILTPFIYLLFVRQAVSDTERSLYDSLQLSDDLVKAMPAGIYIYDFIAPDRLILADANQAAQKTTGKRLDDWKGKSFDEIWPGAKEAGISEKFLQVARTGIPFEEENLMYKDDTLRVDTIVHVFSLPNNRLAVTFVDITDRKRAEEALQHSKNELQELATSLEHRVEQRTLDLKKLNVQLLSEVEERKKTEALLAELNRELELLSYRDGLTGVANRRMFDDLLEKEWLRCQRNKKPLSLLMFDIDYFKQYNDQYGHQMGDSCLQMVAQTLSSITRRPADLFARYGGEEFVLLLPETDGDNALLLAEQCREQLILKNIPHASSSVAESVTISCGVCCTIPKAGSQSKILIKGADDALYAAKNSGRNRVALG